MSEIQRWTTLPIDGYAFPSDDGPWVTYADHVAAVEQACADERHEWEEWSNEVADLMPEKYDGDEAQEALILAFVRDAATAYEQGQRDERGKHTPSHHWDLGYEQGQRDTERKWAESIDHAAVELIKRDERERIRTVVTGLPICTCPLGHDPEKDWCALSRVLAVIDGEASA